MRCVGNGKAYPSLAAEAPRPEHLVELLTRGRMLIGRLLADGYLGFETTGMAVGKVMGLGRLNKCCSSGRCM